MDLLHFIETSIFQRKIDDLLSVDEYQKFQEFLSLDATVGDTIAGTVDAEKSVGRCPERAKAGAFG